MIALTDTNLFVLDQIEKGAIHFVRRRNGLSVAAVHARHVHRLIDAGCLTTEGTLTDQGHTELASYRARYARHA